MWDLYYEETYHNVKNGVHNHEFQHLIDWIKSEFDIVVYNVIYDTMRFKDKTLLNIILKREDDQEEFHKKVGVEENSKVTSYFESYYRDSDKYNSQGIHVDTETFESAYKFRLSKNLGLAKDYLIKKYSEIWHIDLFIYTFFTFTYKDEQIEQFKQQINELSEQIYEILKPFDEFNFLEISDIKIHLDSKENFDRNYDGNWLRYFN